VVKEEVLTLHLLIIWGVGSLRLTVLLLLLPRDLAATPNGETKVQRPTWWNVALLIAMRAKNQGHLARMTHGAGLHQGPMGGVGTMGGRLRTAWEHLASILLLVGPHHLTHHHTNVLGPILPRIMTWAAIHRIPWSSTRIIHHRHPHQRNLLLLPMAKVLPIVTTLRRQLIRIPIRHNRRTTLLLTVIIITQVLHRRRPLTMLPTHMYNSHIWKKRRSCAKSFLGNTIPNWNAS